MRHGADVDADIVGRLERRAIAKREFGVVQQPPPHQALKRTSLLAHRLGRAKGIEQSFQRVALIVKQSALTVRIPGDGPTAELDAGAPSSRVHAGNRSRSPMDPAAQSSTNGFESKPTQIVWRSTLA